MRSEYMVVYSQVNLGPAIKVKSKAVAYCGSYMKHLLSVLYGSKEDIMNSCIPRSKQYSDESLPGPTLKDPNSLSSGGIEHKNPKLTPNAKGSGIPHGMILYNWVTIPLLGTFQG